MKRQPRRLLTDAQRSTLRLMLGPEWANRDYRTIHAALARMQPTTLWIYKRGKGK